MPSGVGSSTPSTQSSAGAVAETHPSRKSKSWAWKALTLSRKHFLACAGIYDAVLSLKAHSVRTALSAGWEEKHTLRRRKCPVCSALLCAVLCCSALDSVWVTQRGVSDSINFSIQNSTHRTRRVAANKLFKVFFFGEFFIHRKIHKNERIVCKYIENWKLKLAQKFL